MKFVLVILVVLAGVWLWRRNRAEDARDEAEAAARAQKPKPPPAVQAPAEMVSCRHCGLHLPAADAVAGAQGPYCSQDHRRRHEA
ncbi:MAG: PP0621 family protein [Hydrogenophaga sp.]|nr:PP0621 family protein [Hydrogenophaga sp.]